MSALAGPAGTVHVIVPESIDDPRRPSGGNVYDRRVCDELAGAGWTVHEHRVSGSWPRPTPADQAALAHLLADLPDRAIVLADGLIASLAESVVAESGRLRLVVLVHMPCAEAFPDDPDVREVEGAALGAADAVVTTSRWAREWVVTHHGLVGDRVHVARPGVDLGPAVAGSAAGAELLCVAALTPTKGHDTLLDALGELHELDWRCACVGALDLDPEFVDRLAATARRLGIADRIDFRGPLTRAELDAARSRTDLVVSASRRESFGMAVAEGLARGIPAITTYVGGQPEAVGRADDGSLPGILVPAGDPGRLAAALRQWLTDPRLRERLRRAARDRRSGLTAWPDTAHAVGDVLSGVSGLNPTSPTAVSPSTATRPDR